MHPSEAAVSTPLPDRQDGGDSAEQPRAPLTSRELLGNQREVRIEHEGSQYVLRATRNGKLILTK
mgnify:CR=1 FL=1